MKKITKQALIWSGVGLGVGGIATGIAVPIALDRAERSNISPTRLTGDEHIWANGPTINELMNKDKETVEVKNINLLKSSEHQLAFYLYEQEQKASINLQLAFFKWHKYQIVKSLENFYKDTLKKADFTATVDNEQDYTNLSSKITNAINAITDADDKKAKQDRFNTFKEDWTTTNSKINKINNNTINYSEERFSEKYPKVLLPLNTIKDKHQKIYDDQKNAFVSQAADKPSGEREWFSGLSSRFQGATTEAEAVDTKVFAEIHNKAYARFQYSIDSSFTYKQFKSGIFKDFLGDPTTNIADSLANNGVAIKATPKDEDKLFFLASKSNIPAWLNPVKGDKLQLNDLTHLTRTNNAILGFKQDKTDINAPWTADKGMLTKLFSGFMDHSTGTDTIVTGDEVWSKIFKDSTEDEKDLTKRLVQSYSMTTDATQNRSGDLGVSTSLGNMQMVPGFSLGTLSIMHDLDLTAGTHEKVVQKTTFLSDLMTKLRAALTAWMTSKGITAVTKPSASDANLAEKMTQYNEQIKDVINTKMTDDDIKVVFGTVIRDAFNNIDPNHKGIPLAIELGTNIYGVVSEEYGLHIIKFRKETQEIKALLKEDLKKAVEKQNTNVIATNYASLLLKNLTTYGKMFKILGIDNSTPASPTIGNTAILDYLWDHKDRLETESTTKADLEKEIGILITKLMKSEYIAKVNAAAQDKIATWLKGKLDKHLILDDSTTIMPEDIYNEIYKAGGGA